MKNSITKNIIKNDIFHLFQIFFIQNNVVGEKILRTIHAHHTHHVTF